MGALKAAQANVDCCKQTCRDVRPQVEGSCTYAQERHFGQLCDKYATISSLRRCLSTVLCRVHSCESADSRWILKSSSKENLFVPVWCVGVPSMVRRGSE